MTKRFAGKVVLITGAARGQGRSHAVRFAEEGADVIAVDICEQIDSVRYPMPGPRDLEETVRLVESAGATIVAGRVDIRDLPAMRRVVDAGVERLGRLDFVLANAGILPGLDPRSTRVAEFDDAVDVMVKGTYYTIEAALPALLRQGTGGAVVITSSGLAQKPSLSPSVRAMNHGIAGYTIAKSGLIGLMHHFARALGERRIRVNSLHPSSVSTPMVINDTVPAFFTELPEVAAGAQNLLPGVDFIDTVDVTEAAVYLCAESGRYITGLELILDAGSLLL
ncbi:mycofactocin-coupled SDR family oxidoreductase [Mycobacterium sp. pW049]|uniref:mycofactocin-coupled SDR family oxidoreductase n=1 Tax=[Mycobacterium] bulgaricum TaxID=3238985 RepID=UPI00351B009A